MAYLGRGLDKISNIEILDNITFDGSSSYSITKGSVAFTPNSAQSLLISIDGVVQATNFTVNGSTIDFGVAIPSTSTCNFFLHYGTGVMTVPSDGSVTNAKLGSGSFSNITGVGTLSSGLTLSDNILFDTASKGIYLGVTSATSSNLLDDYEEGTFTPEFADSITGGNLASGTFSGFYTKIGRMVHIDMNFPNINTTGMTSSGTIRLRNLPFIMTTATGYASSGSVNSDRLNFTNYVITNGGAGSTALVLKDIRDNTTDTNLTVASVTVSGGTDVSVSHTYITDA
jgi:hypothetical protein